MTKKTTTTPGKRPQIQASIDPALFERIKAEAAANFDSVSAIVEARLNSSFAEGELPKTPFASTKERGASVDLTMKEIKLAQIQKQLLTVDEAVRVVEGVFGEMKTEGHTLLDDIAREFNLDAEHLRRRFDEAMAGPFAVNPETYQRLADDFAKEPLPS